MHILILLMLSLTGTYPGCSADTFLSQKNAKAVVMDMGKFGDSRQADLERLL